MTKTTLSGSVMFDLISVDDDVHFVESSGSYKEKQTYVLSNNFNDLVKSGIYPTEQLLVDLCGKMDALMETYNSEKNELTIVLSDSDAKDYFKRGITGERIRTSIAASLRERVRGMRLAH